MRKDIVPFPLSTTFGLNVPPNAGFVEGYVEPPSGREHRVPQPTPWFQFPLDLFRAFILFTQMAARGKSIPGFWITGPTGAGKTSFVLEVAARVNQPVANTIFHADMEFEGLIGSRTLIDGEILFLPGPLLDAVRHGEWFVGNEGDLANPGMATALNAILDRQPLTVLDNGGEVVPIHPRFRFFMTSNTKGAGDESGLYQGTRMQNAALRNRFCWAVADYPSPDEEKAILAKTTPELDDYLRNAMVAVAAESRRLYVGRTDDPDGGGVGGELEVVISTRTLIAWAEATWCARGFVRRGIKPHEYALDFVLGHSASATSRMALQEILQRHMGDVAWTASPQSTP